MQPVPNRPIYEPKTRTDVIGARILACHPISSRLPETLPMLSELHLHVGTGNTGTRRAALV